MINDVCVYVFAPLKYHGFGGPFFLKWPHIVKGKRSCNNMNTLQLSVKEIKKYFKLSDFPPQGITLVAGGWCV